MWLPGKPESFTHERLQRVELPLSVSVPAVAGSATAAAKLAPVHTFAGQPQASAVVNAGKFRTHLRVAQCLALHRSTQRRADGRCTGAGEECFTVAKNELLLQGIEIATKGDGAPHACRCQRPPSQTSI